MIVVKKMWARDVVVLKELVWFLYKLDVCEYDTGKIRYYVR